MTLLFAHAFNEHVQLEKGQLLEEQKEREIALQALEQENRRLELQVQGTSNYRQWSTEELVTWIVSRDPANYAQYEESLLRMMTEEEVDGACLDGVDIADLKRWGVKKFKDTKPMLSEIKALLSEDVAEIGGQVVDAHAQHSAMQEGAPTAYL